MEPWTITPYARLRYFSVFRIRVFFPDPDGTCFPESGSGSDKNPDTIRKIRIHGKKCPKTESTGRKIVISYLALSTLSFLVSFLQNLSKTSLRSISLVNGRIRILNTATFTTKI